MPALTVTQRVIRNARRRGVVVHGRKAWGTQHGWVYQWRRVNRRAKSPADTVVQHITVTNRSGIKADARTVERIGWERFKSGVSYNWLVDMVTGEVALGQSLDAKGTHTVNDKNVPGYSYDQNLVARAIAVVGMPGDQLSEKAERAIVRLLAAMVDEGAVTRGFDYDPHSKFAYKDCPCDPTRTKMARIRAAVKKAL
jgi:hypothetical protein